MDKSWVHRKTSARGAVDEEVGATGAKGLARQLLCLVDRALRREEVVQLRKLRLVGPQRSCSAGGTAQDRLSQRRRRALAHLVAREEEGRADGLGGPLYRVDERRV